MKKRIIRLSLVLALMLCLSVSVFAESQLWHITDDAGILTESQNIELETYAENISQDYGVGIYVVTVNNYEDYYDSAYETAWQIYHAYELGEGADRNGVILLLSMDNRQFATFFYGPRAEYAFDKHGQEKLEDYFLDHFRADDWTNGIYGFLSGCDEFLSLAASGTPVRRSPWGTIAIIALASCVFSLIVCMLLRGKMKSVRMARQANAYVSGELNVTASRDQYTHTTETRTKIEHESSSGGDSSAESGGGGSGRSGSF